MSARAVLVVATATLLFGCPPSRSAFDAARDLDARTVGDRRHAVEDLDKIFDCEGALPAPVVQALIDRFPVEPDPETKRDIMKVLVETGDAYVKVLLDDYLLTIRHDEQKERAKLYQRYAITSGHARPDQEFPRGWPYGSPGFPDLANAGTTWVPDAPAPPLFTVKVELGGAARRLFDTSIFGFDFDNTLGARTKAGIWGVRMGMMQGATEGGRWVSQYRVGPFWEAPTEYVRPSIMLRLTYLRLANYTTTGSEDSLGLGVHIGLTADFWRSEYDHAVYWYASGGIDGWFGDYGLPGGATGIGASY